MPVVALIGAQWGDEGKGHIVDWLASQARMVIRYGGGNNAGHTVVNEQGTFKLHTVPSGIFDPETINIIGHGVAIDPEILVQELDMLQASNISTEKLFISNRAHIIMPYHVTQDQLQEQARGDHKIGTTGRGVGPCFADKMSRIGIRAGDLVQQETLLSRLQPVLEEKNRVMSKLYGLKPMPLHETFLKYVDYGVRLGDHIVNTHLHIQRELSKDTPVLLEGAQGALLDVDHGTYPYVTSSPPGAAGACQGSGVGPTRLNSVIGVYKAYVSRVGEGPMPTELAPDTPDAEVLLQMGKPWAEVGTTTGRQRRVGWFDTVMARYAADINGIDTIAITKLDVLDGLEQIQLCVAYKLGDELIHYPPASVATLNKVEPVYEELPGWKSSTSDVRSFDDLPSQAQHYISRICELVGARLGIVAVGPEREQTIMVEQVF